MHHSANLSLFVVYARVSSAYDDFILPYIDKLSDRLDCIDNSFYDSSGFDCIVYATFPHKCLSADGRANAGVTANEACCACGGGTNEKRPSSAPSISSSPTDSSKPSGNPISLKKGSKSRKQSKAVKGTNTGGGNSVYGSSIAGMSFGPMSYGSFSMIESMSIGESSE